MPARSRGKPKTRIGALPPRYLFALNPHAEYRATRCPHCSHRTHPRKFALLLQVDPDQLVALGKTCRYCPRCELIIAHQNELEALLVQMFEQRDPAAIGNAYWVIGTVERPAGRVGLRQSKTIGETLPQVADFKGYREIEYEPGGWYPAKE